ncbi:hypothetical protein EDD17DRAFT_1815413 [Pisolithus thermaeus]|nr:hypothetical protein EV401DRAFT_2177355 [Pisolithus croceorrhizus]KAI6162907.1 hypothetical protein EDD17DRAFT_1815413 [Pisolithus thermaeus]
MISIFRNDLTGVPSPEIVQLLNKMIKERYFKVQSEVRTRLLHLRLKNELDVRASDTKVDRTEKLKKYSKGKAASRQGEESIKERKEIEEEIREAEAEVDKEEGAGAHTETLKLLFVLYFRVLKNPHPSLLLPVALRGISKFAHLVNVDFFKDLIQVLWGLIVRESTGEDDPESLGWKPWLLSGQGEALNIDLSNLVNHLYVCYYTPRQLTTADRRPSTD